MAQVLVRDVDTVIVEKLRARAREHGRSLEAELRDILQVEAMRPDKAAARALAARIRRRIGKRPQTDSAILQAEGRMR
jgi:plasmid stability protein